MRFLASVFSLFFIQLSFSFTILPKEEAFQLSAKQSQSSLELDWQIAENCYLYQQMFRFEILDDNLQVLDTIIPNSWPAAIQKDDPEFGLVDVFENSLTLNFDLSPYNNATAIRAAFQGCLENTLCYPPQENIEPLIPFETQTATTESNLGDNPNLNQLDSNSSSIESRSLWLNILIFLALGIGLAFTPCVLPMIPILSSIIVKNSPEQSIKRGLSLSIAYVLGMALTYTMLGLLIGLLGAKFNLTYYLQSPWALMIVALIFILLSLSMFGLFELQLPRFIQDRLTNKQNNISNASNSGLASTFILGALSALVVSPCVSAPLAGSLIYISSTGSALSGGLILFALALGMGLPLIAFTVFGHKLLPKAGYWMNLVKHLMGFLLIGVALWILKAILPIFWQFMLWGLFFLSLAIYLWSKRPLFAMLAKTILSALAIMAGLISVSLFIGGNTGSNALTEPLQAFTNPANNNSKQTSSFYDITVTTLQDLEAELKIAQKNKQIALVDFYADWCVSCIIMEREVFSQNNVQTSSRNIHKIKADVTVINSETKDMLSQLNVLGLPAIYFFDTNGKEIKQKRILGEMNQQQFLQHIEKLP